MRHFVLAICVLATACVTSTSHAPSIVLVNGKAFTAGEVAAVPENTAALRADGIGERDPDPPGGRYGRNADGTLNGWLCEQPLTMATRAALEAKSEAELFLHMRRFAEEAVRYGVTSVQSMPALHAARMQQLTAHAALPVRWRWMEMEMGSVNDHPAVPQNPAHFMIPEIMAARYGGPHREFQILRSLLSPNIPLALGSDGPLNPWLNVMFATTPPLNPSEAITSEQAIIAYMRADLAVLSHDVFTIAPAELPKTESVLTIVGGKIVYRTPF